MDREQEAAARKLVKKGQEAESLLNNALLQEVIEAARDGAYKSFIDGTDEDAAEARREARAVNSFTKRLERVVEAGAIAARDLHQAGV